MIKIEKTEVVGWEPAIRGMRNPKNSWDRSDSGHEFIEYDANGDECFAADITIGPNDHKLMMNLAKGGPVHAKYRRMITVYVDITAPLYWWKEFDTYKVGTVANSCSTMHKIHSEPISTDDFSLEYVKLCPAGEEYFKELENLRVKYNETGNKKYWYALIQLLPSSYNQKRTIMLNYEVLAGIYPMRRNHKLDEWHDFCRWIESLPYSEIMIPEMYSDEELDPDWEGK